MSRLTPSNSQAVPRAFSRLVHPVPLLPVAIGITAGILLDRGIGVPARLMVCAMVVAGIALYLGRRRAEIRIAAVVVAAAALGALLHDLSDRRVPVHHIARYAHDTPRPVRLTGTLVSDPVTRKTDSGHFARWMRTQERTRLLVDASELDGNTGPITVTGLVQVVVLQPVLHLKAGDRVRIVGMLYRPAPPANQGQVDWSAFFRRQGIRASMSVKEAGAVTVRNTDVGGLVSRTLAILRGRLRGMLRDSIVVDETDASLLDALVLGQRRGVPRALNDAFLRTGTIHFLSVSGTHVGILALFIWWIAGAAGMSRPAAAMLVFVLVEFYVVVTEPCIPIFRTGIMCGLMCIAVAIRRSSSPLNVLIVAWVFLLMWRPCDLFAVDFQLSFGIVFGLILVCPVMLDEARRLRHAWSGVPPDLAPHITELTEWQRLRERFIDGAIVLLSASITAWLVGTGIAWAQLGQISLWGWLNSLILWPFISVIVIGGFIKVLIGAVFAPLGSLVGVVIGLTATAVSWLVGVLSRLPWVMIECGRPAWWCILPYFLWLGFCVVAYALRLRLRWIAVAAAVPAVSISVWVAAPWLSHGELTMWVLSVGGGQAVVARMPDGRGILFDAGSQSGYDVGRSTIVPALKNLRPRRVDRAFVSHANMDHYNGLLAVADTYAIGGVSVGRCFEDEAQEGGPVRFLLDGLQRRRVPISQVGAGEEITIGNSYGVKIEVLWPPDRPPGKRVINDDSLVLRLRYAGRSVLFCGDIGAEPQRRLIATGDIRADVLVLPHHGSVVETTAALISAVNPQVVIRSGGRPRGLRRIRPLVENRGYHDTSRDGAVRVSIGHGGLNVQTPYAHRARIAAPADPEDN